MPLSECLVARLQLLRRMRKSSFGRRILDTLSESVSNRRRIGMRQGDDVLITNVERRRRPSQSQSLGVLESSARDRRIAEVRGI